LAAEHLGPVNNWPLVVSPGAGEERLMGDPRVWLFTARSCVVQSRVAAVSDEAR
jgi:hypothetical protein